MRVFYLLLLSQASLQLQCDKSNIQVTVGGGLHVVCQYDTNHFRFNKKYWCLGESKANCEILMDSDGFTKADLKSRAQIVDGLYRGLHILLKPLQLRDTGTYWVGIDKIYSDIMYKIKVKVTEEAVSRPVVRVLGSAMPTCHGQPVTLRCRSERGTSVQYSWYKETLPEDVLLLSNSDLLLRCASLVQDAQFICMAHNAVSRERSPPVSLHVLQPGQEDCVYSLTFEGLDSYDCWRTTPSPTTTTVTSVEVTTTALVTQTSGRGNQSLQINKSWTEILFTRSWSGLPLWYDAARWFLFAIILGTVGMVHIQTCVRSREQTISHKHQKHS